MVPVLELPQVLPFSPSSPSIEWFASAFECVIFVVWDANEDSAANLIYLLFFLKPSPNTNNLIVCIIFPIFDLE